MTELPPIVVDYLRLVERARKARSARAARVYLNEAERMLRVMTEAARQLAQAELARRKEKP